MFAGTRPMVYECPSTISLSSSPRSSGWRVRGISGGIEFNWPAASSAPRRSCRWTLKSREHSDGFKDHLGAAIHDPMSRMKGHARRSVCNPGKKFFSNSKSAPITRNAVSCRPFLWWANVATRVHEAYQSFFPPGCRVCCRSRAAFDERISVLSGALLRCWITANVGAKAFPLPSVRANFCSAELWAAKHPLDYARTICHSTRNIPVPTSYMCMGQQGGFFRRLRPHGRRRGLCITRTITFLPGKKTVDLGANHEFGYAWDRNLTDADARGEFAP